MLNQSHTHTQVNAKLSDYGIACYATESGLTQPMGTAGCKAPELLAANTSYMPYNDKVSPFGTSHVIFTYHRLVYYICDQVDIYSFGLLLFVMMTNGHRPFEELAAGFEIDKFIMEVIYRSTTSPQLQPP
jgi:serine/threonine protein kinase